MLVFSLEEEYINETLSKECTWIFPPNFSLDRIVMPEIDSKVYYLISKEASMALAEVYALGKGNQMITREVVRYSTNGSLSWTSERCFYCRRSDLGNLTLRIGFIPYNSVSYFDKTGHLTGFGVELFRELGYAMNFTPEFVLSDDGRFYGHMDENGDFDGLFGLLQRKEVHWIANYAQMAPNRIKVSSFTHPIRVITPVFVVRPESARSANRFYRLLSVEVWGLMSGLMVCMCLWACLIGRMYRKGTVRFGLGVAGGVLGQGMDREGEAGTSFRILLLTSLLMGMMVAQVLSAGLASNLSVAEVPKRLEGVEDILDKGLHLYTLYGSSNNGFFKYAAENSSARKIWDQMRMERMPKSLEGLYQSFVMDEKAVILTNPEPFKDWVKSNPVLGCDVETTEFTRKMVVRLAGTRDNAFVGIFDHFLERFSESGVLDRIGSRFLNPADTSPGYVCSATAKSELSGVDAYGVMELFEFLALGMALGALVMVIEVRRWTICKVSSREPRVED